MDLWDFDGMVMGFLWDLTINNGVYCIWYTGIPSSKLRIYKLENGQVIDD